MGKLTLQISRYMSPSPLTIGPDQPLAAAHRLMRDAGVRHLPVLSGDQLVGMVSMDDLHLVETLQDVDPAEVRVDEAMAQDPFCVSPEAPLDDVCAEMAEHKYGSTVVMDAGRLVGVFTTIDALRALSEIMRSSRQ